jgi:hypothetical protein
MLVSSPSNCCLRQHRARAAANAGTGLLIYDLRSGIYDAATNSATASQLFPGLNLRLILSRVKWRHMNTDQKTDAAVLTISPAALGATAAPRYHALDCVRAAAMFLGIFYHLQFISTGGFGFMGMPGFGAAAPFDPKAAVDAWLHSFRMPLFFLISGFFANMMLAKYGLWKYLARRWWRIGAPLLVAFIGFGLLRTYFPQVTSSAFGGMAFPTTTQPSFQNTPYQPFGQGFQNAPQGGGFGMTGAPTQPYGQMPPGGGFGMTGVPGQPSPGMPAFKMPAQPSNSLLDAILKQANAFQDWIFKKMPWTGSFLSMIGGQKGQLTSANFHFEHL